MGLEVTCDPDVAPLPPHITLEQAKAFMAAGLKRDSRAGGVIAETAKQLFGSLVGGKD